MSIINLKQALYCLGLRSLLLTKLHLIAGCMHGSVSPVLTATVFVNEKGQILTPLQNRHPSTNRPGDYVGEPHASAKFGANPFTGSVCANRWNVTKNWFIYTRFSVTRLQFSCINRLLCLMSQLMQTHNGVPCGASLTLLPTRRGEINP